MKGIGRPRWLRLFWIVVLAVGASGWAATEFLHSTTPTGWAPSPYATQGTVPCGPAADNGCGRPTESCAELIERHRRAQSADPDPKKITAVICSDGK
ncbi:hypothetical protein [Streptomyces sp. NPDC001970]